MRTVRFIFSVCLSLFAASFVTCEADKEHTDGPSYEAVLKNSINQFLMRRYQFHPRWWRTCAKDTTNLEKIGLHWRSTRGSFDIEMGNTTLTIDPNYNVDGVRLRGYHAFPEINLVVEFTIPEVVIENVPWSINGTWGGKILNGTMESSIVYRNMSATMEIVMGLKEKDKNTFLHTKHVMLDTVHSLRNEPAEHIPLMNKLPKDLPYYELQMNLKRAIVDQIEPNLRVYVRNFIRQCPWKRFLVARF